VVGCEILLPNAAVRHLIREGKFQQIYSELQTHQDMGMQTMNNALLKLWRDGRIAESTAIDKSPNVVELKALMEHTRYGTL